MSLLSCTALRVRFGSREVLQGIDFEARTGELVGLIGPNGAGKTTLARALAGLIAPESGEVLLEGAALATVGRRQRARAIGYLAQSGEIGWPMEVRRVVELGRSAYRPAFATETGEDCLSIEAAMAAADVLHLASRPATALSGGERARVLIARVLAGEPRIILADEPVSALDPYHQLQIMDLLKAHTGRGGGAVVVLHDLVLASRFCDRLVLLDRGAAVADGSPRDVLSDEILSRVYHVRARTIGGEDGADAGFAVLPWARDDAPQAGESARDPAQGSVE